MKHAQPLQIKRGFCHHCPSQFIYFLIIPCSFRILFLPFQEEQERQPQLGCSILRGSFIIVCCLNGKQRVSLKSLRGTSSSKYINSSLMDAGVPAGPPRLSGGFVSARGGQPGRVRGDAGMGQRGQAPMRMESCSAQPRLGGPVCLLIRGVSHSGDGAGWAPCMGWGGLC